MVMAPVQLPAGYCAHWRGCDQPVVRGSYFCAQHRVCLRCGEIPGGSRRKLTRGMCIRCYQWWRRNKSPARRRIAAQERARTRRRAGAKAAA